MPHEPTTGLALRRRGQAAVESFSNATTWAGERKLLTFASRFPFSSSGKPALVEACLYCTKAALNNLNQGSARVYCFGIFFSIASRPFQAICTPMHSSTNAITRRIPCTVCGAIF